VNPVGQATGPAVVKESVWGKLPVAAHWFRVAVQGPLEQTGVPRATCRKMMLLQVDLKDPVQVHPLLQVATEGLLTAACG